MREHVAADLAERRFEKHERPIVASAAGGCAQTFDGFVEYVQSFVKLNEGGVEFKSLVIAPHGLRSP